MVIWRRMRDLPAIVVCFSRRTDRNPANLFYGQVVFSGYPAGRGEPNGKTLLFVLSFCARNLFTEKQLNAILSTKAP